mmetsp:Transcript_11420/g.10929  ORF Transcript_11420/g.10929 Transcript_11420/m.10929 type:complete len:133 (-) Transcript_11420:101-499(-)
MFAKAIAFTALFAGASAFNTVPTFGVVSRPATAVFFEYGEYDDKLWDNTAKIDVYTKWNPAVPRSGLNFNPFETFLGNSPDASGKFPGETWYKDPTRGDVSFAAMMEERKEAEDRAAAPKPGDAPGCPGCRN